VKPRRRGTKVRKVDFEIGDWIELVQNRGQWWTFMNIVMKLRVP
jgi:hypothetical protein